MTIISGNGILAHSRPDKIVTSRFLPLYIRRFLMEYQQKKPLKYHILLLQNSRCSSLQKKI